MKIHYWSTIMGDLPKPISVPERVQLKTCIYNTLSFEIFSLKYTQSSGIIFLIIRDRINVSARDIQLPEKVICSGTTVLFLRRFKFRTIIKIWDSHRPELIVSK